MSVSSATRRAASSLFNRRTIKYRAYPEKYNLTFSLSHPGGGGEKTAEGREFKTYKKKEEKGRKRKTERKGVKIGKRKKKKLKERK